jgi:hypothetical protein
MQLRASDWIDRLANELGRLGTRAEPHQLADFGSRCAARGDKVPEQVARAEFEAWPLYGD